MKVNGIIFSKTIFLKDLIKHHIDGGNEDKWLLDTDITESQIWDSNIGDYENLQSLVIIMAEKPYTLPDRREKIVEILNDLNVLYKAYKK